MANTSASESAIAPPACKRPRLTAAADDMSASTEQPLLHVHLTAAEERLFAFLLDVERQYACACVLRVAGGWVRDKLLGRESDDVDIVLDRLQGRAFADLVNAYEADHGHQPHAVGVIKANPEQSKHLETATMQLGDVGWVDFVNLRAETYSEHHRIPEVVRLGICVWVGRKTHSIPYTGHPLTAWNGTLLSFRRSSAHRCRTLNAGTLRSTVSSTTWRRKRSRTSRAVCVTCQ